jgi:hypothetical protein
MQLHLHRDSNCNATANASAKPTERQRHQLLIETEFIQALIALERTLFKFIYSCISTCTATASEMQLQRNR